MTPAFAARSPLLLTFILACGGGPATTDATSSEDTATSTTAGSTDVAATSTTAAPTTSTSSGESADTTSPGESSGTGTTTTGTTTTGTTSSGGTSSGETSSGETSTGGSSTGDTSTGGTSTGSSTGESSTGESSTGGPDGFGVISGDCGLVDAMELESPMAFVFTGAIDFGVTGFDYDLLTPGGQEMFDAGNLNAGSLESEIVAYEVLARCDMAALLKTEGTIVYSDPMGKKTDILVEMDGLKVGVSVVRAVGFPQDDPYTVQQATTILNKKLADILISSQNVAPEDAWVKQILSVVAYAPGHVDSLLTAYAGLDPAVKADTILVITATDGNDLFIYD